MWEYLQVVLVDQWPLSRFLLSVWDSPPTSVEVWEPWLGIYTLLVEPGLGGECLAYPIPWWVDIYPYPLIWVHTWRNASVACAGGPTEIACVLVRQTGTAPNVFGLSGIWTCDIFLAGVNLRGQGRALAPPPLPGLCLKLWGEQKGLVDPKLHNSIVYIQLNSWLHPSKKFECIYT